jgi:hypothetical protein
MLAVYVRNLVVHVDRNRRRNSLIKNVGGILTNKHGTFFLWGNENLATNSIFQVAKRSLPIHKRLHLVDREMSTNHLVTIIIKRIYVYEKHNK